VNDDFKYCNYYKQAGCVSSYVNDHKSNIYVNFCHGDSYALVESENFQAVSSTTCSTYFKSNTNSGQQNYAICQIEACSGDTIVASGCVGSGHCAGDQYLRLFDEYEKDLLISNDDGGGGCGLCSLLNYTVAASDGGDRVCQLFELHQGCFENTTCSGQIVVTGGVVKSSAPTVKPTSFPTNPPTLKPSPNPTPNPTADPTGKPTPQPTSRPTDSPTFSPSQAPTVLPSFSPSNIPTPFPTASPTVRAGNPTPIPTTASPTTRPTSRPTFSPTCYPTQAPNAASKLCPSYLVDNTNFAQVNYATCNVFACPGKRVHFVVIFPRKFCLMH
jgi:hypothetical protein